MTPAQSQILKKSTRPERFDAWRIASIYFPDQGQEFFDQYFLELEIMRGQRRGSHPASPGRAATATKNGKT